MVQNLSLRKRFLGIVALMATTILLSGCPSSSSGGAQDASEQKPLPPEAQEKMRNGGK